MKDKSADQIQAEIDLMRLAYRQRCERIEHPPIHPLLHLAPYLISAGVTAAIATVLHALFF